MAQLVPLLKPIDQRNEIVSEPSETIEIEYVSASALAVTPVMPSILVVKGSAAKAPDDMAANTKPESSSFLICSS